MIRQHDGLDRLWEADVNWKTLNPQDDEGDEEPSYSDGEQDPYYTTTVDPSEDFVPTYVHDLLEYRAGIRQEK